MIKKLFAFAAATGLLSSLAGSTPANDEKKDSNQPGQKIERSLAVDPQAVITLRVASGTLTVRGWEKQEVRVRSVGAEQIEFRRMAKTRDPDTPPARVDVIVCNKVSRAVSRPNPKVDCQPIADVEMDVPAAATVHVQTRDGDINISGIAGAMAGSQNGDIVIERITKWVEAGTLAGSILLRDSSGRVSLSSAGGGVEAMNVRAAAVDDIFEVGTVSGDIRLDRISNPKVMAKTVNGAMIMSGALVKAGYYAFTNMTGDVLLALPQDASFRLNAKVSDKQNIVSDFALKYLGETPLLTPPTPIPRVAPAPEKAPKAVGGEAEKAPAVGIQRPAVIVAPYVRRVEAICGSGDATISVASFGGTVRLKKL